MKKIIKLLAVNILVLLLINQAWSQQNPFDQKKRVPHKGQVSIPSPMAAISNYPAFLSGSRQHNIPSYKPAMLNLASLKLAENCSEIKYNRHGQLIFLTGTFPRTKSIDIDNPETAEKACFEYLDKIRESMAFVGTLLGVGVDAIAT